MLWDSKTPSKINPFTQIVLGNAGWIIDDLRISNRARTDEEIAAAYASGQPLPVDEWTTLKMNFDGSLSTITTVGDSIVTPHKLALPRTAQHPGSWQKQAHSRRYRLAAAKNCLINSRDC